MILSLQNISTETPAQSRLAVLRRELCRVSSRQTKRQSLVSHSAFGAFAATYRASLVKSVRTPIFGGPTGKPGGRMPAASFSAALFARDPRANAQQEGSP